MTFHRRSHYKKSIQDMIAPFFIVCHLDSAGQKLFLLLGNSSFQDYHEDASTSNQNQNSFLSSLVQMEVGFFFKEVV